MGTVFRELIVYHANKIEYTRRIMKELSLEEMKRYQGGCNAACECIDAFVGAGMEFNKAYHVCVHQMELDPTDGKEI
jgi:hypothetical protein